MKPEQFLYGCAYYDEYMPKSRIDIDFPLIRDAGMNVIRIAESTWSTWEPREGQFDFTSLIKMLQGARKYGLSVIIGTPTYAVPSWLVDLDPDVLSTTHQGKNLYGHRQLTDLVNPTYLKYAERVTRKLLDVCRDYNDVIIGYQLDNETRSADSVGPIAQKMFAERLRERFGGDLDKCNLALGMDYWSNKIPSWDEFPDVTGTINGSLDGLYKEFLRDLISEFLMWLRGIINDYKTPEQFVTHNFDYSWIGYSFGMQKEVTQKKAAQAVDIPGVDIYHPSQEKLTGIEIAMGGAIGRSLKKDNYLVLETQCQGRPSWTPFPGQLTLQALSHLASGAGSVMYWHYHSIHNSYETYWKGILSHDLKPGRCYNELKEFGGLMKKLAPQVSYLKKSSEVAILLDNRSLTGIDEFPCNGEEAFKGDEEFDYNHIMRTWFDSCYKLGLETDFCYEDDDFGSYKLLIIPSMYSATEDFLARLRGYIANGGHVIITPRCFFSDEFLKVYPTDQPHGLTKEVGAIYSEFTNPPDNMGFTGKLNLKGNALGFMEFYSPLEDSPAKILASYNHTYWGKYAAVMRNGNVTTVGCYLEESDTQEVLKDTLSDAGLTLPSNRFPLIVRRGVNRSGEKITFVFNYSMEENLFETQDEYTNLVTDSEHKKGDRITLPPWGYLILKINA